jgi:diguanylate cyclase (GGDEF)-like protein
MDKKVNILLMNAISNLSYYFNEFLHLIVKNRDYRTLNDYILRINQLSDIKTILYEASRCLKEILNYDLFAFGLVEHGNLKIWIDPRYSENNCITTMIKEELDCHFIDADVLYFDSKNHTLNDNMGILKNENLVRNLLSFPVRNLDVDVAKLYILPKKTVFGHQKEVIGVIVKIIGIALSNLLHKEKIETSAMLDPLTSCYNRRTLDELLSKEVSKAQRYTNNLSILMLDVDHFKAVNDCYGHLAGDHILKEISDLLKNEIRNSDYIVRYGGEEFIIVLPEIPIANAVALSERIKDKIEMTTFRFEDSRIKLTISIGISSFSTNKTSYELIREADEMLYISKNNGRNRITFSTKENRSYCLVN